MATREWFSRMAVAGVWSCLVPDGSAVERRPARDALDHLLLGASDLDRGIEWFEARTGVRAAPGGSHPGLGTRNALASLGPGRYLEIIAPDPARSTYRFHLDVRTLDEPRLITWAVRAADIDAMVTRARESGHQVFGPAPGSRTRPDGSTLHWRTAAVLTRLGSGAIEPLPFFIEWAPEAPHPSRDAPGGCTLERITFEHPDPDRLTATFQALGLDASVHRASAVRIRASLNTSSGAVELA